MFVASSGGNTETDIISECIKGIGNRIFFILFQLKWNPNSSSPILHFFAAVRLYIHMVYIMVYTNVNIGRMLAMTPPTSTANSQERWHENREFFKKNVPSVIRLSFLNCSQSRNFKALGWGAWKGWWQMDGFRGFGSRMGRHTFHINRRPGMGLGN